MHGSRGTWFSVFLAIKERITHVGPTYDLRSQKSDISLACIIPRDYIFSSSPSWCASFTKRVHDELEVWLICVVYGHSLAVKGSLDHLQKSHLNLQLSSPSLRSTYLSLKHSLSLSHGIPLDQPYSIFKTPPLPAINSKKNFSNLPPPPPAFELTGKRKENRQQDAAGYLLSPPSTSTAIAVNHQSPHVLCCYSSSETKLILEFRVHDNTSRFSHIHSRQPIFNGSLRAE
ncbi:uncharacterized protein LOC122196607 [Lactuca sativa]|uniref:uncharacterized protein LOC122196607 n=1 Tax=Lactuca sativa TaxID=4236 RepID=UPI0022AF28C0|nr:uncharacterized protein LOC122196607 [Lactuca sativa]